MITQPVFKAFAENVMEAFDTVGSGAELNSTDPLSRDRRAGLNKSTYDSDSTRPRQQSAQDRPPRAGYGRPAMTQLSTNYDPQLSNDKYSAAKLALVERLARLAATDIPGTPRLFMRHRSPKELADIQKAVTRGVRRVEAPLERKLHKATAKLPKPLKKTVRKAVKMVIRNPEQLPLQPVPVPGISPATLAIKKGLEYGIDRFAPMSGLAT
jgi:hypothetical protein